MPTKNKLRITATDMKAYCFASGHIGFGPLVPTGAILMAWGPQTELLDFISGVSRHAYDGKTLLVPGVPEASDESAAADALDNWLTWISRNVPPEISTIKNAGDRKLGTDRSALA